MESVASPLRRLGAVLAVLATLLAVPGTSALASSTSTSDPVPGSASTPASVAPEVSGKAAGGDVSVIAVTRVPGEQVVDDIAADLPPAAAETASGGKAEQVAVTVDAEGLAALAASPDVVQVVENKVNRITADPWTNAVGLATPHTAGYDGTGRTIAVLDTGVQADHPYLAGTVVAEACFSQPTSVGYESLCPSGATQSLLVTGAATPCVGIAGCEHGTHVAGIAAGGPVTTPSDLTGVAPGASIIAVKVFTRGTTTGACQGPPPCLLAFDSEIANAMAWLGSLRAGNDPLVANLDAINLSLGGGSFPGNCDGTGPTIKAQVGALRSQGIATVAASGNSGQNGFGGGPARMSSPACITDVISVGATTNGGGTVASYSNLTAGTTIVAPGSGIDSSKPTSAYGLLSGTSMATPVISGAIAALRQQQTGYSVDSVVGRLRSTGSPVLTPFGSTPELQLDSAILGAASDVRSLRATPRFRSVALAWTAPSYLGLTPITGYTVTASPGGATCTTAGLGCTVSGLTNGTAYNFSVSASIDGLSGAGTSIVATPQALPAGSPFGSVDVISAGVGSVNVAGWAIDPETAGPIPVHVYVDGTGMALTADASRPDVDAAFGYGADHGFSATVAAPGGVHSVCVYGINSAGTGGNVLLGCRSVSVASGVPFGSLDVVSTGLGTISVAGWAIDPDTAGSVQVHVYVDGAGYVLDAVGSRPDVGAAFPGFGSAHGFGATVPVAGGAHTVCAYAVNVGAGSNVILGCRVVSVPGGSPFGSLDLARRNADGTITVSGWAIDPDTAADIQVHVYFVGPSLRLTGIPLIANQTRSDVGVAYPAYGSAHGYSMVSPAFPAAVTLCAYGINVGSGATSVIGCAFVP